MQFEFGLGTVSDGPWTPVGDNAIRVNLGARMRIPYEFTVGPCVNAGGWVFVERRDDDLFVDDRKVLLRPSPQKSAHKRGGWPFFKKWLDDVTPLDPRIAEALCENQHLIPEKWRRTEKDDPQYVFFPAVVFVRQGSGKRWLANISCGNGPWAIGHSAIGHGLRPDAVVATTDP